MSFYTKVLKRIQIKTGFSEREWKFSENRLRWFFVYRSDVARAGFPGIPWALFFILSFNLISRIDAQTPAEQSEFSVKAKLIVTFLKYVKWPPSALPAAGRPLRIGILGNSQFNKEDIEWIHSKKAKGNHRLEVVLTRKVDEVLDCPVIFICRSEDRRLTRILDTLKGHPILTVGETRAFARKGGMIRIWMGQTRKGPTLHFETNTTSADKAQLKMDPFFLKLSETEP